MVISPDDLEFAVLKIFENLRIPMGGKLGHSTLVKEWSKTHLRTDDLTHTITRLETRDALKKEHAEDDQLLQLTQCGFSKVAELRHHQVKNWFKHLRIKTMVALMRNNHSLSSYRRHTH